MVRGKNYNEQKKEKKRKTRVSHARAVNAPDPKANAEHWLGVS